jgi:hypothetical protein
MVFLGALGGLSVSFETLSGREKATAKLVFGEAG